MPKTIKLVEISSKLETEMKQLKSEKEKMNLNHQGIFKKFERLCLCSCQNKLQ